MSRNFLQSLDLPQNLVHTPGNLLVVHEQGRGDGQFVLHCILADFFNNVNNNQGTTPTTSKATLVTTKQSQKHWADIGSKLGWNLKSLQERGSLHIIDLLKAQWNHLSSFTKGGEDIEASSANEAQLINPATDCVNLTVLYDLISSSITPNSESTQQLLIIEDLSALLYQLSSDSSENWERFVMEFLCKLKRLCKATNTCLLTLVHSSEESVGDHESTRFAKLLSQSLADICISVFPLFTGFSSQITGHIHIRNKVKKGISWNSKSCQYKLEERNVRITFI